MPIPLSGRDINHQESQLNINRDPDCCPVCKVSARPLRQTTVAISKSKSFVEVVYRCPREECAGLFIAQYILGGASHYNLQRTFPSVSSSHTPSEEVTSISTAFGKIYNQALDAENLGLTEIAGMGFRKALEFLIKDYCISKNPGKEEAIKKTLLGPCIQNFVTDPNIKACSERATWLGNDETHYTRQWESHDIEDLKRLVRLTENWISNEVATANYLVEMQKHPSTPMPR